MSADADPQATTRECHSAVAAALAAEAEARRAAAATRSAHHDRGGWCGPCLTRTHCRHIPGSPGSRNSPAWVCGCDHCAQGLACECGVCTGRIRDPFAPDDLVDEPDEDTGDEQPDEVAPAQAA